MMTAQSMPGSCPFCGAHAGIFDSSSALSDGHAWRVECLSHTCHSMTCWWHSEAEAIAAWNRRALPRPSDEGLIERPDAAIDNLANHQTQADMDGVLVTVSRQALDETLGYLAALRQSPDSRLAALEEVAKAARELIAVSDATGDHVQWFVPLGKLHTTLDALDKTETGHG